MAMTLRLDGEELEALRRRAKREGRSMQQVARTAIRDYVARSPLPTAGDAHRRGRRGPGL